MKTNLDLLFKSNTRNEIDGVWFDISEDIGFHIKRFGGMNSPAIKKALAVYHKPYARLIEKGLLDESREKRIYTQVFVESCMLNWKGVEIDGEFKEYSDALAVDFLTELPELLETLVEHAQTNSNYADDVGN